MDAPTQPAATGSKDGATLEAVVVGLLARKHLTLATAESCTGGLLASRITDVPGASAVFTHGFVTYANAAKTALLDVSAHTLDSQGAVSESVARQMAAGTLRASGAHLAVAVTGIAGPDGGTPGKPAGTAWIALAVRNAGVTAFRVFHPLPRPQFKQAVCDAALDALHRRLVDPDSHPFQE